MLTTLILLSAIGQPQPKPQIDPHTLALAAAAAADAAAQTKPTPKRPTPPPTPKITPPTPKTAPTQSYTEATETARAKSQPLITFAGTSARLIPGTTTCQVPTPWIIDGKTYQQTPAIIISVPKHDGTHNRTATLPPTATDLDIRAIITPPQTTTITGTPTTLSPTSGTLHSHTCYRGHTWSHRDGDPNLSHNCPQCGAYQNVVDTTPIRIPTTRLPLQYYQLQPANTLNCPNGNCPIPGR